MSEFSSDQQQSLDTPWWVWTALAIWIGFVGAGWVGLTAYANQGTVPDASSSGSAIAVAAQDGVSSLQMFLHPHCPCSAASLRELQKVMTRAPRGTECTVYFYRPTHQSDDWVHGSHWTTAQQIPNVRVQVDPAGALSTQRQVKTSGEVQAFDCDGVCRFQGGLTPARGHEGDTIGGEAILALLGGQTPRYQSSPVFGCTIQSPGNYTPRGIECDIFTRGDL